jgi:hypothetical protein
VASQDSHREYRIHIIFLSFNAGLSRNSNKQAAPGSVNAKERGIQELLGRQVYLPMISIKY